MTPDHPSSTLLREIIARIQRNEQSTAELTKLKALAHAMAVAGLRRRKAHGEIHPGLLRTSLDELAEACVTDLFGADARGAPPQLAAAFATLDLSTASSQEILVALRRIVFAGVNAVIDRAYGEADPALGEIIRALHLCADDLGIFRKSERFGIRMLAPVGGKPFLARPVFTLPELVDTIRRLSPGTGGFYAAMSGLSDFLRTQATHAPTVPLVTLALAYRQYLLTSEDAANDTSS